MNNKNEGDINQSEHRVSWYEALDKATKALLADDAKYFIHQSLSTPCMNIVEACEGIYLYDGTGRKIMDFHGNNVHQVGYRNPKVIASIKAQLDTLPFSPRRYANRPAMQLAKRLSELSYGNSKVLFAPGGTSTVGIALKLARIATGRHKVLTFWDSFHGASLDAISVGGESQFRSNIGPLLSGVEHVPPPTTYRKLWEYDEDHNAYADYIEYVVEKEGDFGCFIGETIRNTDVQIPSLNFWGRVRDICTKHGIVLILDEIPICLGRTGKMFAYEHYGIKPDICVIGKGLGGAAIPIAAVIADAKLDVAEHISVGHYTHEKSTLGTVAGLAVLDFIKERNLLAYVVEMSEYYHLRLSELMSKYEIVGDIRGIGLLWGVEIVLNKGSRERASEKAEQIMYECLRNGLSFKVSQGNVIQLSPPLIISKEQSEIAFEILENAIKKYEV